MAVDCNNVYLYDDRIVVSRSCPEGLSVLYSAFSVETNEADDSVSWRMNYYYMKLSKEQNGKGSFLCLTCSTLLDGLSDAKKMNTDRERAEKRQRESRQTAGEREKRQRGSDMVFIVHTRNINQTRVNLFTLRMAFCF